MYTVFQRILNNNGLSISFNTILKKKGDVASIFIGKTMGFHNQQLGCWAFWVEECPTEVQPSMSGLTKDGLTVTFTASASEGEDVNQSFVNGDMGDSPEDPLIPTT